MSNVTSLPARGKGSHFNHSPSHLRVSYVRRDRFSGSYFSLFPCRSNVVWTPFSPQIVFPRASTTWLSPLTPRLPSSAFHGLRMTMQMATTILDGYLLITIHGFWTIMCCHGWWTAMVCPILYPHACDLVWLIHVRSHCLEDLAFNFWSGDMGNFRWKSLLCTTARVLANGRDCC